MAKIIKEMKEKNCCGFKSCLQEIDNQRKFCVNHCEHLNIEIKYTMNLNIITCHDCDCYDESIGDGLLLEIVEKIIKERKRG